jgi:acyl-CoA dehydrogenase
MEYFVARLCDPKKKPFGKELREHGVMLDRVAKSRVEIDSARLAVLNAAAKIDAGGAKLALKEIAEVKLQTPEMLLNVVDRAIQAYGAAGLCQDTPLPDLWISGRYMRIVDGPDEVHAQQLGRNETKRGTLMLEKIAHQQWLSSKMLEEAGLSRRDPLELMRSTSTRPRHARL